MINRDIKRLLKKIELEGAASVMPRDLARALDEAAAVQEQGKRFRKLEQWHAEKLAFILEQVEKAGGLDTRKDAKSLDGKLRKFAQPAYVMEAVDYGKGVRLIVNDYGRGVCLPKQPGELIMTLGALASMHGAAWHTYDEIAATLNIRRRGTFTNLVHRTRKELFARSLNPFYIATETDSPPSKIRLLTSRFYIKRHH